MRFTSHFSQRLCLLAALIALLCASPALAANAQAVNCFGLGTADCQLVVAADKNISQETSFNQTFETTATLTTATQTASLSATGSGVFAVDSAALGNTSNQTALLNALKLTLNMSGSVKTTGGTAASSSQSGKANLVVLNGQIYIQATDSTGTLSPWQSSSLSDVAAAGTGSRSGTGSLTGSTNPALAAFQDPAVIQAILTAPNIKGFITAQKDGKCANA